MVIHKNKFFIFCILFIFQLTIAQKNKALFEFQNTESVDNFLKKMKYKVNYEDVYIFRSFDGFFEYNKNGYLKGPIIYVFNSEGFFLEDITPLEVEEKLSNFKKIEKRAKKGAVTIEEWLSKIENFKDCQITERSSDFDYYFVLNWAIFFNKPDSINELFKWYDVLRRQKEQGQNIQIILLDMDLQDSWNLSPEKKSSILSQVNR